METGARKHWTQMKHQLGSKNKVTISCINSILLIIVPGPGTCSALSQKVRPNLSHTYLWVQYSYSHAVPMVLLIPFLWLQNFMIALAAATIVILLSSYLRRNTVRVLCYTQHSSTGLRDSALNAKMWCWFWHWHADWYWGLQNQWDCRWCWQCRFPPKRNWWLCWKIFFWRKEIPFTRLLTTFR